MNGIELKTKKLIDFIEIRFNELWQVLTKLKTLKSNENIAKELIDFQFELAKCLATINIEYLNLSKEIKILNKDQKSFSKEFQTKKEILLSSQEALKYLIYLGKSLGDAYVFFFYKKERVMLNKHLDRQEEFLLPSGAQGRMGELEFVRNVKNIGESFVIYHGITSMLRIRDLSMINLRTLTLTCLGELKTHQKEGDLLNISLYTYGIKSEMEEFNKNMKIKKETDTDEQKQSSSFKERLDKQIEDMIAALSASSKKSSMFEEKLYADSYFKQLVDVINENKTQGTVTYKKASNGLLLIAIRPTGKKLSERFYSEFKKESINEDEFIVALKSIFDNNSQCNGEIFGSVHYSEKGKINSLPGTKPLFWSPIPIDIIKQIYFKEVIIITVYNPIFLLKQIQDKGFDYDYVEHFKSKCFVRKDKSFKVCLGNLNYYISLISQHLLAEELVMDSINIMLNKVVKEKLDANTQINMEYFQA